MVRDDDRVDAGVGGELGVLVRENALDHDFHLGQIAQPFHEIPRHGGGLEVCQPREVDPVIHGSAPAFSGGTAAVMASRTFTRVGALQPVQGLLVAAAVAIHRYRDCGAPRFFRARHEGFGDLPFIRGVELVPDWRAARGGDIFHRAGRDSRENLQMVSGFRRLGDVDFAARVEGLLPADRRDDDRGIVFHAEDLGAHIDLADVDQTARAQLEFQEAFAVGPQGDFVVHARGHVAEMRRRNVRAADRLEIEHVDRVLGTLDEIFRPERRPHDGVGKFRACGRAFTREG